MDPYAWVNDFQARAVELQRKSVEAQENLAAVSGTASSKDGAVTVTVGPNGGLTNLQLGHRAVELGAPKLTALILETARQAQKNASAQVVEAFRPIGEGTETMAMITDIIADEFEESDEPDELHAVERIEEDDEPVAEKKAAPTSTPAPAQPSPPRGRRPADDADDDENQPW